MLGIAMCPGRSMVIFSVAILLCFVLFISQNYYRYRKIKQLNYLLTKMQSESANPEWEEYREGELSILYSQLVKVTNVLREQREAILLDKNYLKDALSDISHQLKTPMTSMMVMVDLLAEENLPMEKRQEFTKKIARQLNRMEWLISILLKMSKLDAGTIVLEKKPVKSHDLFERATAHLAIPMELREIEYCEKGENITLQVDMKWFAEALANIVKNCMEHTAPGGKVCVWAEKTALYTSIHITDNGCGIAAEDLPHVFERFYRGKNADTDSVGIGLALASQIVTLENGNITVESEEGKGTHFHIKLYKVTKLS
jgi:signal transduction histidine kinase